MRLGFRTWFPHLVSTLGFRPWFPPLVSTLGFHPWFPHLVSALGFRTWFPHLVPETFLGSYLCLSIRAVWGRHILAGRADTSRMMNDRTLFFFFFFAEHLTELLSINCLLSGTLSDLCGQAGLLVTVVIAWSGLFAPEQTGPSLGLVQPCSSCSGSFSPCSRHNEPINQRV